MSDDEITDKLCWVIRRLRMDAADHLKSFRKDSKVYKGNNIVAYNLMAMESKAAYCAVKKSLTTVKLGFED